MTPELRHDSCALACYPARLPDWQYVCSPRLILLQCERRRSAAATVSRSFSASGLILLYQLHMAPDLGAILLSLPTDILLPMAADISVVPTCHRRLVAGWLLACLDGCLSACLALLACLPSRKLASE